MIVEISTRRTFEAAHHLPMLPEAHKCHRVHGHNYVVEVSVRAEIDETAGMAMDYAELDRAFDDLVFAVCDHRLLNDVPGLENPTGENIAIWIALRMLAFGLPIHEVSVWETPCYRATVRVDDLLR